MRNAKNNENALPPIQHDAVNFLESFSIAWAQENIHDKAIEVSKNMTKDSLGEQDHISNSGQQLITTLVMKRKKGRPTKRKPQNPATENTIDGGLNKNTFSPNNEGEFCSENDQVTKFGEQERKIE